MLNLEYWKNKLRHRWEANQLKKSQPLPNTIWTNPTHFMASGFGLGLLPWTPGTWGTLLAIPFIWLLSDLRWWEYVTVLLVITLLGIAILEKTSQDMKLHDHPGLVLDETIGFMWAMTAIPLHWPWVLAGVCLFRFFDIWKPGPIQWLDRHGQGGFGMVIDDLAAAAATWLVLKAVQVTIAFL